MNLLIKLIQISRRGLCTYLRALYWESEIPAAMLFLRVQSNVPSSTSHC